MNRMESYYPLGPVLRGEKSISSILSGKSSPHPPSLVSYRGSLLCRGSQRLFLAPLRNALAGNTIPYNSKSRCLIAGVIITT